jgi:hypothetical protein
VLEQPLERYKMDTEIKKELRKEINRIVDAMIQMDSLRESISELKKDIKTQYDIPVATITKVATILRKQNLTEEEEKWATIREYVDICS